MSHVKNNIFIMDIASEEATTINDVLVLKSKKDRLLSLNTVASDDCDYLELSFLFRGCVAESEKVILCWVDDKGHLHHHYVLKENKRHVECTRAGHAFALIRVDKNAANESDMVHARNAAARANAVWWVRPMMGMDRRRLLKQVAVNFTASTVAVESIAKPDNEYRVIVRHPHEEYCCVPADVDWMLTYEFVCPPLPAGGVDFDPLEHTFYVWGDLDFAAYDAKGKHAAHAYLMNQLVPQVMTGRCLASNDASHVPQWHDFSEWVIQAQYYWQTDEGERRGSRAMCGPAIAVAPGTQLKTTIQYFAVAGSVLCTIEGERGARSQIYISRPFPDTTMYASWRSFFHTCAKVSNTKGALARPGLNIEYKGDCVDIEVLRSVCPLRVRSAAFPGDQSRGVTIRCWPVELFCPRLGECHELRANHSNNEKHDCNDCLAVSEAAYGCGDPLQR